MNEYITIEKAAELTNKSISTIRRFVQMHNDSEQDIIRTDLNSRKRIRYKINKEFVLAYFTIKANDLNKSSLSDMRLKNMKRVTKLCLRYQYAYHEIKKFFIFATILFLFVVITEFTIFCYLRKVEMEKTSHEIKYLKLEIDFLMSKSKGSDKIID
jgi:hypothetical protein